MFDTSKVRRLKWKARLNERRHRVAAAWNRVLAGERDVRLRTERSLNRWRRGSRRRMEVARQSAGRVKARTEAATRRAKRNAARKTAKAAAKTAVAVAATKMATAQKKRKPARATRRTAA